MWFHQCGFISGFVSAGFISGFVSAGFISGFIHVVSSVRFHQWFYQCGFISAGFISGFISAVLSVVSVQCCQNKFSLNYFMLLAAQIFHLWWTDGGKACL